MGTGSANERESLGRFGGAGWRQSATNDYAEVGWRRELVPTEVALILELSYSSLLLRARNVSRAFLRSAASTKRRFSSAVFRIRGRTG